MEIRTLDPCFTLYECVMGVKVSTCPCPEGSVYSMVDWLSKPCVDHVGHIEGSGYAFLEIGNKGYRIVGRYGSGVIGVVADPRAVFCPVVKFVSGSRSRADGKRCIDGDDPTATYTPVSVGRDGHDSFVFVPEVGFDRNRFFVGQHDLCLCFGQGSGGRFRSFRDEFPLVENVPGIWKRMDGKRRLFAIISAAGDCSHGRIGGYDGYRPFVFGDDD